MAGCLKACGGLAEILKGSQQGKIAAGISIATGKSSAKRRVLFSGKKVASG
jgi:hypothetical protein